MSSENRGVLKVSKNIFKFELNNRQAKFIANDVRVYEFFGLSYELPFWDIRIVDFFCKLPYTLLCNRNLHKSFMRCEVDDLTGVFTPKANDTRSKMKNFIKRFFPQIIDLTARKRMIENQLKNLDAFYDHFSVDEFKSYIDKYGTGFNLNTNVALDYINLLK